MPRNSCSRSLIAVYVSTVEGELRFGFGLIWVLTEPKSIILHCVRASSQYCCSLKSDLQSHFGEYSTGSEEALYRLLATCFNPLKPILASHRYVHFNRLPGIPICGMGFVTYIHTPLLPLQLTGSGWGDRGLGGLEGAIKQWFSLYH